LQNCAPFPHMTLAKNIAFTPETSECPQDDCGPRVTIPRPVTVEALEASIYGGRRFWSSLVEDPSYPIRQGSGRDCPANGRAAEGSIGRGPTEDQYKANRLFTLLAARVRRRERGCTTTWGVDWADETDAVWVVDDEGATVQVSLDLFLTCRGCTGSRR
jgi:hypothetical protein